MREMSDRQMVECMICGVLVGSVFSYHKHNVRKHSLAQLSRAILKLRNLKLPLTDPAIEDGPSDGDDDDDDDDIMCGRLWNPLDDLKLPVKVEAMDEVIELAPTANSDHLKVQSRLLSSCDEVTQHSSQVIEVKENNPPPPPPPPPPSLLHQHTPHLPDVNATTVKLNNGLAPIRDSISLSSVSLLNERHRSVNDGRVLRATFKTTIDHPSPGSCITDYREAMSLSSDKYIMHHLDRVPPAPAAKRKRGRPRKNTEDQNIPEISNDIDEDEECEFVGDPPLFSDEEDEEEQSTSVPSAAKTRSGRTVKVKKLDAFKYLPVRLKCKSKVSKNHKDDVFPLSTSNRRSKVIVSTNTAVKNTNSKANDSTDDYKDSSMYTPQSIKHNDEGSITIMSQEETDNIALMEREFEIEEIFHNTTLTDSGNAGISPIPSVSEYDCIICLKMFNTKEDSEKHMHEHLSRAISCNAETRRGDCEGNEAKNSDDCRVNILEQGSLSDIHKESYVSVFNTGNTASEGGNNAEKSTVFSLYDTKNILSEKNGSLYCSVQESNESKESYVSIFNTGDTSEDNNNSSKQNHVLSKESHVSIFNIGDTSEGNNNSSKHSHMFSLNNTKDAVSIQGEKSLHCSVCSLPLESCVCHNELAHDGLHECKTCGKKYESKATLQKHITKYHKETHWMKFKCAICGESFGFVSALERHMKEKNHNEKFSCEECGKVFKNLVNLQKHLPLHTKDEVFKCLHCSKQYYVRQSYEKHLKTHIRPAKFHCEICNKDFNEKKKFEIHLERHQSGGSLGRSNNLRCNYCGDLKTPSEVEIISETDLGHHKTCLACGKGHYKKFLLENPGIITLQKKGERERVECRLCGKLVLNLKRHVMCHHLVSNAAYVPCDVCGVLVTKSSLPRHKNRKHGSSSVICDHCNKPYKNIVCLREHMTALKKKNLSGSVCKLCKALVPLEVWMQHMLKHRMEGTRVDGMAGFTYQDKFILSLQTKCNYCVTKRFSSQEEYLAHVQLCSNSNLLLAQPLGDMSEQQTLVGSLAHFN